MTRIALEDGTLLHEGPEAPSTYERALAAHEAERDSHRVPIDTAWGRGWYDDRSPGWVHVEGRVKRPVG